MFGLELTGSTLFWVILGSLIGLLVELLLFKAACALADVTDPSWLVSLLIVLPFFVGRGLLAWVFYERLKNDFEGATLHSLSFLASGLVFWIVCAGLYALVLSVSLKKSFVTASVQVLLDALIGSLGVGITLFVLSLVQIKQGPANKSGHAPVSDPPVVAIRHAAP